MPETKPAGFLHARITENMRQNILKGEWEPGRPLPRETDLADSYCVSRMTMNKVLTQLSREGFLVRRKRSGTFVAQPRAQSAVMAINDIVQEVAALGMTYEWRLFEARLRTLSDSKHRLLDLSADAQDRKVFVVSGLHLAQGRPFCLETRAIDARVVPAVLTKDFKITVPGQWLLQSIPFSTASNRIRAVNSAGRDARVLDLPVGAACLEVLRKTKIEQSWVTHVRLLYPGEAHQLVAEFAPQGVSINTPR